MGDEDSAVFMNTIEILCLFLQSYETWEICMAFSLGAYGYLALPLPTQGSQET